MAEDIIRLKKELSEHELSVLSSELEKHKKSTALAYVLCFFLGTLGIHKFYIGKPGMGILYLILGVGGWISLLSGIIVAGATVTPAGEISTAGLGGMGLGIVIVLIFGIILGILLFVALFTIPGQIRKKYEEAERQILARIRSIPDYSRAP